jgi:tetratricopeptide (TPR) repeat protein
VALERLQKYQEALASYDKAIQFKPDKHEAWYGRGIALRKLEQYQEAIASYDKAIQFKPDFYEAWLGRGVALAELKQYQKRSHPMTSNSIQA